MLSPHAWWHARCLQVTFGLHPSFAQPLRVCSSPPFEVTETGWGEFDITIAVRPGVGKRAQPVSLRIDAGRVACNRLSWFLRRKRVVLSSCCIA